MLIIGNWKVYVEKTVKAKKLVTTSKKLAANKKHTIVVAPSYPHLGLVVDKKSKLKFAAQDVSSTNVGASTGEVSAALLADMGVTYVILGHSERRARGESDAMILEKVRHVLAQGMIPVVCIGEKERDVEAHYLQTLRTQVECILAPLSAKERLAIVFAYEPIWAIGKPAAEAITPADLTEMILYLRKVMTAFVSEGAAANVRILYGGSVEPANARTLASATGIDGFLIGRASTISESFTGITKSIS